MMMTKLGGSGILVGVFGAADVDINCLGFALLRRASAQLIGVEYPDISTLLVTTSPVEIKNIKYNNSGSAEQHFTFDGSKIVTTKESWSVTAGMESGIETEVTAGVPILAEAKVKVSLKISASSTYKRSSSETTKESFSFPINVPARECVQAIATIYEGNINTKYTAKMVYALVTGKVFSYNITGVYNGIAASEAIVNVKNC